MRLPSIVVLLCLSLAFSMSLVSADEAGLQVGVAKRSITPNPLLPISGGMGPTQEAEKLLGKLMVRVAVFESGESRVAILSFDLLGFPAVLAKRVCEKVPSIAPENVLCCATHTHSAPDVYAFPDGQGGHTGSLEYIDFVCAQAAEALNAALESMQPARLRVAVGEAEGKIAYNYYAPDLYDRRVGVIQAADALGQTIVTLVNYAVHPEVLGADGGVMSPDLVGPLCDTLEEDVGGMALFVNGAQGGMVTADNRDLAKPSNPARGYWEDLRTWEECQRIGKQLASESLRIVAAAEWQAAPPVDNWSREVTFPIESEALWNVVKHSPLGYPHGEDRTVNSRINLAHIGSARILTIPGEALPNIGFYLKRKLGSDAFLFGLTNDAFGYILTEVDYGSFDRYDYISRVSLGEQTGAILIENALELMAEAASSSRP